MERNKRAPALAQLRARVYIHICAHAIKVDCLIFNSSSYSQKREKKRKVTYNVEELCANNSFHFFLSFYKVESQLALYYSALA